jgi:CzcA family heavy metal efflux pump
MKLLELLSKRVAAVWLVTAVLVVVGVWSALAMPSSIYPEVEFSRIVVVAKAGDDPADVFLATVTRPLEQTLTTVLGVERIRSKTIRGATEISLQFAPGTDMWRSLQLVEARVNEARAALPAETEVTVERVTTGSFPVVTFNLAGPADPRELRELAEFVIRPGFASVNGVARVEVLGGDVREVEVVLDPERAAALSLTPERVAARLRSTLGLRAVGRVVQNRQLVSVLTDAQPAKVKDIEKLPVATAPDGVPIALGSVAEVRDGWVDRLVRVGGPLGSTVVLSVSRLPGASTTDVVREVSQTAKELERSLPQGVRLTPVYDQASVVEESIASVRDAILIGILLCAGVIATFLRDARAGLLAALTVPLTLAITFVAMQLGGQTVNMMSLGGMAVAIGLVVDDAIVVVEAISRRRDLGEPVRQAAFHGAAELAPAVIGTTLTTVVVFVPLALTRGVVGDFFRALAFTLTAAVVVSLAVSLTLVPLASGLFLAPVPRGGRDRLTAAYQRVLHVLVPRPVLVALALLLLVGAGVALTPFVERGFLPKMDEGAFVLDYFLPAGSSVEETERVARGIGKELEQTEEVQTFSRRLGAELGPATATLLSRGDIMVRLGGRSARRRETDEVIADLRQRINEHYPEARIEFVQVLQDVLDDLAGNPRPVEVKVFGQDYAELHRIANEIAGRVTNVPGLVDVYSGEERPSPELRLAVRQDVVGRLGSSSAEVSDELSAALLGSQVGSVRHFDRLIGVRVRYPNPVRFDLRRVLDMPFTAGTRTLALSEVAKPVLDTTPTVLLHEALGPMVAVTGDQEARDLGSLADEVEKKAKEVSLPKGYRLVMGGQAESQRQTLRQLSEVAGLAVLLVLAVLSVQFRRFGLAALVLTSIPAALVGALGALVLTGTPLNASSLMGSVLLVGLVVKNGVLLLEEAERARAGGASPVDSVTLAASRRLRPVLMTTLATLAGLMPLALGIGAGAELQQPLAIAVIGGLLTSTIATLGVLPAFAARVLAHEV